MSPPQLTFVEEIALLALDDESGALRPMPVMAFSYALAGAVICDLALLNRLDTDPAQLVVLSREATGDPLLDRALAAIAGQATPRSVSSALALLSGDSRAIEAAALDRLVARGILRRVDRKILWVFGVRRYPTVDNQERTEVRTRLAALLLGDDLPDPRDAILLSLLISCQLANRIFAGPEFNARAGRFATFAKLDLVGREVAASIAAITQALGNLPLAM